MPQRSPPGPATRLTIRYFGCRKAEWPCGIWPSRVTHNCTWNSPQVLPKAKPQHARSTTSCLHSFGEAAASQQQHTTRRAAGSRLCSTIQLTAAATYTNNQELHATQRNHTPRIRLRDNKCTKNTPAHGTTTAPNAPIPHQSEPDQPPWSSHTSRLYTHTALLPQAMAGCPFKCLLGTAGW